MKSFGLALVMFAATAVSAAAEEDCRLQLAATLPMDLHNGAITVPASLGDIPLKMVIDTGASNSVIRESLARKLGLHYDMLKNYFTMSFFGGVEVHRYSTVNGFTLGKLKGDGLVLTWLPDDNRQAWPQDGLLGANVLGMYDVDFDFAKATMRLFAPHRCPGRVVYWTQDESQIAKLPIEWHGAHIRVPVEIQGHTIKAVVDTGANVTVMDLETYMPEFGLTPTSPGVKEVHESRDPRPEYLYTFKEINFQGVTVKNARVLFVSEKYSHDPDYKMLIGTDILMQLHLYIAYQQRLLIVTPASAQ